ncbi:hypothetical protein [Streptomyces lunalinharesii]|uniref:Uncharacterized protein n=1 Tax=Streptomyces lunalinharesii TaxID=333384 RepID=A0ABN3S231_9ACTN
MTARRPLLTAAAAGSLLFALWFVPSANAIVGDGGAPHSDLRTDSAPAVPGRAKVADAAGTERHTGERSVKESAGERQSGSGSTTTRPGGAPAESAGPARYLADTGSPNTAPYAVGGAACLALGAALVGYSVHRTRDESA